MTRDWDDAFSNSAYIPGSEALPELWAARASAYRQSLRTLDADIAYGAEERHRYDLAYPDGDPKGLVVFIHGGFWLGFSKSDWTDLAEGARANGWAVALPSYTLAPDARISQMGREIAAAVRHAATRIHGPIRLAGHSAGGHLATRMVCDDGLLPAGILGRVEKVLSISGVHDLRPLQKTAMNKSLKLTDAEAISESPALRLPAPEVRLTCWVGAAERPEFLRQSRLLAAMWGGEAETDLIEEPGHNHFSVIEALKRPDSPIVGSLLA
jgi:acetyl esterase/lipase